MPRPAWLAIGAAAGALALEALSPLVLLLWAGCVLAVATALRASRRPVDARKAAAIGLGVLAIGLRGHAAHAPAVTPAVVPGGDGPWIGAVQSVGALRAGSRPALIRLE